MPRTKPRPLPATPWRPTRAELAAAIDRGRPVRDVIEAGLSLLLVGINPGLYSAAIGHHFGRPGNRFWPALHAGGLTPRLLSPFEEMRLLEFSLGLTNLVDRTTARADELTPEELRAGARRLARKVRRFRPHCVAIFGLTAYRTAFDRPRATLGRQPEPLAEALLWLLPNPSGLNAHHQPADLARMVRELAAATQDFGG